MYYFRHCKQQGLHVFLGHSRERSLSWALKFGTSGFLCWSTKKLTCIGYTVSWLEFPAMMELRSRTPAWCTLVSVVALAISVVSWLVSSGSSRLPTRRSQPKGFNALHPFPTTIWVGPGRLLLSPVAKPQGPPAHINSPKRRKRKCS